MTERPDQQERCLYDAFHPGRSSIDLYSNDAGAGL